MQLARECPVLGPTHVTVSPEEGSDYSNALVEAILSSPEVGTCCAALREINDSGCFCERTLVNVMGSYVDPTQFLPFFDEMAALVRDSTPYACGFFIRGGDGCEEQVPEGWDGSWTAPIAGDASSGQDGTDEEEEDEDEDEEDGCLLADGQRVPVGWSGKDAGPNACNSCGCGEGGHLLCTQMFCGDAGPDGHASFLADYESITTACPAITDAAATVDTVLSSAHADRPRRCCAALRRVNDREGFCGGRLDRYYERLGAGEAERIGDLVVRAAPEACGFAIRAGDDCTDRADDGEHEDRGVLHAVATIATGCPAFWDAGHLTEEELTSREVRKCCSAMRRVDDSGILCRRGVGDVLGVLGSGGDHSNPHLRQYLKYFDGLADRLLSAAPRACGFFVRTGGDCEEHVPDGWTGPVVSAPWQHDDEHDDDEEDHELDVVDAFDGPADGLWEAVHDGVVCRTYHSASEGRSLSVTNRGPRRSVIASRILVPDDFEITHMTVAVNITYASTAPLKIELRAGGAAEATRRRRAADGEAAVTLLATRKLARPLELRNTSFADIDGHTDSSYELADADSAGDAREPGTVFSLPRAPRALRRALARRPSLSGLTVESRQSLHAFHSHRDGEGDGPAGARGPRTKRPGRPGFLKRRAAKEAAGPPAAGTGGSRGRWRLVIETADPGRRAGQKKKRQGTGLDLDVERLAREVLAGWSLTLCRAA